MTWCSTFCSKGPVSCGKKWGMSKAFVNEVSNSEQDLDLDELDADTQGPEDDSDDDGKPSAARAGKKNYITPDGHARLKAELHEFIAVERPKMVEVVAWAASNGDRSENADYIYGKRRLREIDRRIRFLQKRLDIAEVVDPQIQISLKTKKILFGARVKVIDENGDERNFYVVGIDETDISQGKVSWISPIGQALLQAFEGDTVILKTPKGEEELEIRKVEYR